MKRTGFIGTGIMGLPMAANLLNAGHEVCVYNRTAAKAASLVEAGAVLAATPRDVVDRAEVVILMLTGPEAIDSVLAGADGLLAGNCSGKTLINMSTVPPAYSRELNQRLKAHELLFVDAPVAGSRKPAADGTLVIFAGGPQEKVRECEPLFLAMGNKVVYCGEAGQGSAMKITINLLLGMMTAGLCESVNLARKNGLDIELVLDTIMAGHLGCGLFNLKAGMIRDSLYPVQFPLKHMLKDIRFAFQTATETGAAIPLGLTLLELYSRGKDLGLGDMDFAAVREVFVDMSD